MPRIHYFPSAFGDIRVERVHEGESDHTRVVWYGLTPQEAESMAKLREASVRRRVLGRRWAEPQAWNEVGDKDSIFRIGGVEEYSVALAAPVDAVVGVLAKALHPERTLVHVVRIGQGKITETTSKRFEDAAEADDSSASPYREEGKAPAALEPKAPAEVEKTATVKQPVRGCPPPDFAAIKRRATRVLRAFLTPVQIRDFERHQQFLVQGADTGHTYMITSRNAPSQLATHGGRMVYDATEQRAYCVHDWTVPAEEEVLGVALLLQLPGRESFIRAIPGELGGDDNLPL